MEERIEKLERQNRTIMTLLVIVVLLLTLIVILGAAAAWYFKGVAAEIIPLYEKIRTVDFDKLIEAANRMSGTDWDGLETAINNFKETGEILGEFNEKISSIQGFFGK